MVSKNSRPTRGDNAASAKAGDEVLHYMGLIQAVLKDIASICNQSEAELTRDRLEIAERVKCEGISFLTKTLPRLGKAVDLALSNDTCLEFTGFSKARGTKVPRFMRDIFLQVFSADGFERSDASEQALCALRQVFYLFYKLNIPSTKEQNNEVIKLFIDTDATLPSFYGPRTSYEEKILSSARRLICKVLATTDPLCSGFNPRHGPGAVATGEKPWQKPIFKRYYSRLASVFPYEDYFYYNASHLCDDLQQYLSLKELEYGTAKVVLVPKDSRGPRLISCEPLENQWIQQGLMQTMVKTIESHPLTRGHVNFSDQTVNQRLALESSCDGSRVTLDMKEASDRVSLGLVKALFPTTWFDALYACRSEATELPDGRVIQLNKFAPMGSAVCFPVESLIFWALSVSVATYGVQNPRTLERVLKDTYVYGDDIICSREDYATILSKLPEFGLLFNQGKCCVGRFFRESCGTDAFKGVVVTPLRVRARWSSSLASTNYASWVAYHNAFNERGYVHTCDYLAEEIQQRRVTPYADLDGSSVIALVDSRKMAIQENARLGIRTRVCPDTHVYQARAWVVRSRAKRAAVPGWSEMLRIASLGSVKTTQNLNLSDTEFTIQYMASRLAPVHWKTFLPPKWGWGVDGCIVKAYQYTLPRRVSLRRGWGRLIIGRR